MGVAVTVNYAHVTNQAYIDAASITAGGLTVQATMADDGGDKTDTFSAQSTSGAGGGKTGVAGSVAINIAITDTEANLLPAVQTTITGGGDVTLKAESNVSNTAKALPSDGGGSGSSVGVGISVAVNYGENQTYAQMGDGSALTGAHNLDIEATSGQEMTTDAKSGAKGSTAVTPVVAVAIAADDTNATIGSGSLLSVSGNLTDKASLTDQVGTDAEGDTQSSDTGVGISVAVTVVNDNALATTARDLSATGTVTFERERHLRQRSGRQGEREGRPAAGRQPNRTTTVPAASRSTTPPTRRPTSPTARPRRRTAAPRAQRASRTTRARPPTAA